MKNKTEPYAPAWIIIGTIFLLIISYFTLKYIGRTYFNPTPFILILLYRITSIFSIAIMPIIYIFFTLLLKKSEDCYLIILTWSIILLILNILWFWKYWPGQVGMHTKIVAIENAVGFIFLICISFWAHLKKSKNGYYFTSLLMFILLSWCAFPYLGEGH